MTRPEAARVAATPFHVDARTVWHEEGHGEDQAGREAGLVEEILASEQFPNPPEGCRQSREGCGAAPREAERAERKGGVMTERDFEASVSRLVRYVDDYDRATPADARLHTLVRQLLLDAEILYLIKRKFLSRSS